MTETELFELYENGLISEQTYKGELWKLKLEKEKENETQRH